MRMTVARALGLALAVVTVFALGSGRALAVPACPEGKVIIQPDGSSFVLYLRGDEFHHWNEDEHRYPVVQDPQTKVWMYALEENDRLVPSKVVAGSVNPKAAGLKRPDLRNFHKAGAAQARARNAARLKVSAAPGAPKKAPPVTGTFYNLVILVDFTDLAGTKTPAEVMALYNTVGYNVDGAQGSFWDYYNEVSYTKLNIVSTVTDWMHLTNGYAYYGQNDAGGEDLRPQEMVEEAVDALETSGFDFSGLDGNGDGYVDGLTILHAGYGEEVTGVSPDAIWSHQWSMTGSRTYDGKSMLDYCTVPELRGSSGTGLIRVGVLAHEMGHAMGSLPDLYDRDYSSSGAGGYCLMASGCWGGGDGRQPTHMTAWCKIRLTWLTATTVPTTSANYIIGQLATNAQAYKLQDAGFPASEYFLIENRQGAGFDASLPGTTRGLLIWHVDDSLLVGPPSGTWVDGIWNDDEGTTVANHYMCGLVEADADDDLISAPFHSGEDTDYFRTPATFTGSTTPNNTSYGGVALLRDITAISASGAGMTFDINGGLGSTDLVIDSLVHSPAKPYKGQRVTFKATIRNQGVTDANNFKVWFWPHLAAVPTGGPGDVELTVGKLAAGATGEYSFTTVATTTGHRTAWVMVYTSVASDGYEVSSSGGGGSGGGCGLVAGPPAGAGAALGWALPYAMLGGAWLLSRLRRTGRAARRS